MLQNDCITTYTIQNCCYSQKGFRSKSHCLNFTKSHAAKYSVFFSSHTFPRLVYKNSGQIWIKKKLFNFTGNDQLAAHYMLLESSIFFFSYQNSKNAAQSPDFAHWIYILKIKNKQDDWRRMETRRENLYTIQFLV